MPRPGRVEASWATLRSVTRVRPRVAPLDCTPPLAVGCAPEAGREAGCGSPAGTGRTGVVAVGGLLAGSGSGSEAVRGAGFCRTPVAAVAAVSVISATAPLARAPSSQLRTPAAI